MKIINKTDTPRYSLLADRIMPPGVKSADIDAEGMVEALEKVVSGCGKAFCVRLNDKERSLIGKLLDLDKSSFEIDYDSLRKPQSSLHQLLERDAAEKAAKIASIKAEREREEAIRSETTYTSKRDMDAASAQARSMRGDIPAKKLDKKAGEPVSLSDLIGNNRFIEESMKHSNIKTAVASEEGWDMEKINAPKVSETQDAATQEAPITDNAEEAADKPVKKASRRRRKASK